MKISTHHPFFALLSAYFIGAVTLVAQTIQPVADPLPSGGSLGGILPGPGATSGNGAITAPPPEPDAPGVATTIEGINFDQNASNTGFYQIPPDPIGAAGTSHLVSVTNSSIRWHTKAGVQQNNQSLQAFFSSVTPVNATFDPKVIYDSQAGRFVVVTIERRDTARGDAVNSSRILVAVSDDSDPNGTWHFLSINSLINISGTNYWADYPGLGVDEQAIYITNNMFTFGASGTFGGTRLWIINKTPLYTGGAGTFTVHNPFADAGNATTAQPAQIMGTPPSGATGTWLVSYSGLSDGTNEFLQFVRVDNPLTAPTFSVQLEPVLFPGSNHWSGFAGEKRRA